MFESIFCDSQLYRCFSHREGDTYNFTGALNET